MDDFTSELIPTNSIRIQAVNKAESNVTAPPTTTAGAVGSNRSVTAVTFEVDLTAPGSIQFGGYAAPYIEAIITAIGGYQVGGLSVATGVLRRH